MECIASYNHLGNNDGKNLSAPHTFRSKEISKSNVVDDMVAANHLLYKPGEHPGVCVCVCVCMFCLSVSMSVCVFIGFLPVRAGNLRGWVCRHARMCMIAPLA